MPRVLLCGEREPALVYLKDSLSDQDACVDSLVYLQWVVPVVPYDSDSWPLEVGSWRFASMCELKALKTDFIFFVG